MYDKDNTTKMNIDVEHLNAGVYIVKCQFTNLEDIVEDITFKYLKI